MNVVKVLMDLVGFMKNSRLTEGDKHRRRHQSQHRQVLTENHIENPDGRREKKLIRLLPALFRHEPHGQNRHDDNEYNRDIGIYVCRIVRVPVRHADHRKIYAGRREEQRQKQIRGHGMKIRSHFFHIDCLHNSFSSSSLPVSFRNTSSRLKLSVSIRTIGSF